nr:hypothetical protein DM860_013520 [Ipomoea trifida]
MGRSPSECLQRYDKLCDAACGTPSECLQRYEKLCDVKDDDQEMQLLYEARERLAKRRFKKVKREARKVGRSDSRRELRSRLESLPIPKNEYQIIMQPQPEEPKEKSVSVEDELKEVRAEKFGTRIEETFKQLANAEIELNCKNKSGLQHHIGSLTSEKKFRGLKTLSKHYRNDTESCWWRKREWKHTVLVNKLNPLLHCISIQFQIFAYRNKLLLTFVSRKFFE